MTTIERETKNSIYTEQSTDNFNPLLRRPIFSGVRWGAIFAGVATGIAVQILMTLLGLASGLSMMQNLEDGSGIAIGTLVWTAVSIFFSALIGGYVAARMSGFKRKIDGLLHGMVSWAVTILAFMILASSVGGAMFSGIFNILNPVSSIEGSLRNGAAISELLKAQVEKFDSAQLPEFRSLIQSGQRTEAIQMLVRSYGLEQSKASTIVDDALILSGSADRASPQARSDVIRTAEAASPTAWAIFFIAVLSLLAGIGGGLLGATGARRTMWSSISKAGTVSAS